MAASATEFIDVYVDGACRNNGQQNPQGGCGVYWGEYHPLNTSEYLKGEKQTNNRAELTAAIIALAQAHHLHLQSIRISTDSKYVKEGITKWIQSWKANSWKTKQKSDVLNKDLWLTIDDLCSKQPVEWVWVEGHKDVAGNNKADELAKSGISSESEYWQNQINCNFYRQTNDSQSDQIQSESNGNGMKIIELIKEGKCGVCNVPVSDTGIQCTDCKLWYHYGCTQLPAYQLYIYEVSQRRYSCETCSEMNSRFLIDFEEEIAKYATKRSNRDTSTTTQGSGVNYNCVDRGTQSTVLQESTYVQTNISSTSNLQEKFVQVSEGKPTVADKETMTTESLTSINSCLNEFQDVTIKRLENTFVSAVDNLAKVHDSAAELQAQVRKITVERDSLKLERDALKMDIQKSTEQKSQENRKCNCQNLQAQIEDYTKQITALRRKCSSSEIEKEIELSKLQGAMSVMNQKYESSNLLLNVSQQDVETLEKRLQNKNNLIIDLEEKIKTQNTEMLKLQDEILAWKLHASRKDDSLLQPEVKDKVHKQKDDSQTVKQHPKNSKKSEEESQRQDVPTENQKNNECVTVIDVENIPEKKKVLLIGTSNIKYISTQYLSSRNVSVEKLTKYTIEEGQEYVKSLGQSDITMGAVILHLIENDISEQAPEYCSERLLKLAEDCKSVFPNAKIILSLGLPRRDEVINQKICKLNVLLKEKTTNMDNISVCDNGNLYYRGRPSRGVLAGDGKHLSRRGTKMLGGNLKFSINGALGESQVIHRKRQFHNNNNYYDRYTSSSRWGSGRRNDNFNRRRFN